MAQLNANSPVRVTPQPTPDTPVRAWLRVVILLGLGGYFTYNIATGNLANYINARFVWLSYVAAGLFFALGIAAAYRVIRTQSDDSRAYGTRALTWGIILTAAVPLLLGVMVPSAPLGAEAVNGNISTSAVRGTNQSSFTIAPEERNVLDWLRMFNDSTDYTDFNGQPVDVVGFVYREPTFGENEFMVARFTVSCCVADASALGLPVRYTDASTLEEGTWVRVSGDMQVAAFGEDELPVVHNAALTEVERPEHPYLYP